MFRFAQAICVLGLAAMPVTAQASDEAFEFWLNPSVSFDLDDDTGLEIETAQRFRSAEDGRVDTYFTRLWVNQDVRDNVTLSGALERRINDGGSDETRLIQQMSTSHGILRTRLRLEQRLVDDADRMGLRLRPSLGVSIPLDDAERWSFGTNAELFWTLRGNNVGSDEGITGMRTTIGVSYDVSERLSLSAAYLRDQDFEDNAPDEIGHAPAIGIEFSF